MIRRSSLVAAAAIFVISGLVSQAETTNPVPRRVAGDLKKFKVTLSKSSESKNRTVYIDAKDSSEARQTAKNQNPGWQVELVTEVK